MVLVSAVGAGVYAPGVLSFWMQGVGPTRPSLGEAVRAAGLSAGGGPEVEVDVAIVGGGLSGLWTAHHLLEAEPGLRIVVLEAEFVGYGASGRNGGWLSQLVPGNKAIYSSKAGGTQGMRALQRELIDGVPEVLGVMERHGVEIDAQYDGNLVVATSRAAASRLASQRATAINYGIDPERVHELSAEEAARYIGVRGMTGALKYDDVARVDPGKLVRGLAAIVEARGATIHERTRVTELGRRRLVADGVTVRARRIFVCTEGYSGPLLGERRIVPVNSSMIATQVLSDAQWEHIAWRDCGLLKDVAHTFIYAQRTPDGRIAIGGRGVPYRYNSGTGGAGETAASTVRLLLARLEQYFPGVGFRADHAWSGVLGVSRDWCTSVQYDDSTGVGHAVGYAGNGVTTAYVAARSLVHHALGLDTAHARLPWVEHRPRDWEPEPLRWLGIHSMYRLFRVADEWEERRGLERTSLIARAAARITSLP